MKKAFSGYIGGYITPSTSMHDHTSEMYKLGYRAGLNGKSVKDCPHYEHGPQRMDWIKGLNAGRAARINNQIITK